MRERRERERKRERGRMVRLLGYSDGTPNYPPELCVFEFLTFKNVVVKGSWHNAESVASLSQQGDQHRKDDKNSDNKTNDQR